MRTPLSVEQTDKVLVISEWLSTMATVQLELQLAERWDRLEDLRTIYRRLANYLIQVVGGFDHLDTDDWETKLLSGLLPANSIASHRERVDAAVKGAIYDLFVKPRSQ